MSDLNFSSHERINSNITSTSNYGAIIREDSGLNQDKSMIGSSTQLIVNPVKYAAEINKKRPENIRTPNSEFSNSMIGEIGNRTSGYALHRFKHLFKNDLKLDSNMDVSQNNDLLSMSQGHEGAVTSKVLSNKK